MRKRKFIAVIMAAGMLMSLFSGCGSASDKEKDTEKNVNKDPVNTEQQESTEDEEDYNTGDASLDNTRNEDGIGEKELMVVSFGTSYNNNRRLTIGAIEKKLEDSFSDYSVRRGFTSQIIIDHIKSRDNIAIDNVKEALERAVNNGVKTLAVQPTHLMDGFEYNELIDELAAYSDAFEKIAIGKPLLSSQEDFEKLIAAITEATKKYDDGETAICFMGHGTEANSNQVYKKLQDMLTEKGYKNYYIGTVEAEPSLEAVAAKVKEGSYKKVVLRPLMIVAGDHANNDMAGSGEDSWKSVFEKEGFQVECVLKGLGELEAVQEIFVQHAQEAIDSMN